MSSVRSLPLSVLFLRDPHGRQVVGELHHVVLGVKDGGGLAVKRRRLARRVHVVTLYDVQVPYVLDLLNDVTRSDTESVDQHQRLAIEVVVRQTELVLGRNVVTAVGLDDLEDVHDGLGDDGVDGRGLV